MIEIVMRLKPRSATYPGMCHALRNIGFYWIPESGNSVDGPFYIRNTGMHFNSKDVLEAVLFAINKHVDSKDVFDYDIFYFIPSYFSREVGRHWLFRQGKGWVDGITYTEPLFERVCETCESVYF